MSERQSLYELLGLSDKASPEDIKGAFDELRQAMAAEPDGEETRNRRAILQHAHDVLNDRRQRAGYDRRRRDRRDAELARDSAPARPLWPFLVMLLMAGTIYPAWLYVSAKVPEPSAPTRSFSARPAAKLTEPPAMEADIAALLPQAPAAAEPGSPVPKAAAVKPQAAQRLVFEGPDAGTLGKFSDSTYIIIGAVGRGTGVAIERDKLLTNCLVIAPNVLKGPILAVNPATGERARITEAAFLIREDACVVHAPGLNAKPIAIGNAERLAQGARIFNIGFANGRQISSSGELLGVIYRNGQTYLVSSNQCDRGVSGGPLVDEEGRLVGLTSGGSLDRSFCLSITAETARTVLTQTLIAIDAFPPNYLSNLERRW